MPKLGHKTAVAFSVTGQINKILKFIVDYPMSPRAGLYASGFETRLRRAFYAETGRSERPDFCAVLELNLVAHCSVEIRVVASGFETRLRRAFYAETGRDACKG